MEIEMYKYYEAEVNVKNKETLKPDANIADGQKVKVTIGWLIEEGAFKGQFAFLQHHGYWIPQEDLRIVREISYEEYKL